MDCSLPGSSVIGTFQARILEWVAISFSRGSSRPRDWTRVCGFFTTVPPGKPKHAWGSSILKSLPLKQWPLQFCYFSPSFLANTFNWEERRSRGYSLSLPWFTGFSFLYSLNLSVCILFLKSLLKVTSEFLVKPNHSAPFIAWHHLVSTVKGSSAQSATHGAGLGCQLLPVLAKLSTEIDSKCLQTFQAIWRMDLQNKQTNWGLYTDEIFFFSYLL